MTAVLRLKKRSKYNAKPTVVDGIRFASKREASRYLVLRGMEKAGQIEYLQRQWPFNLRVNNTKVGTYVADFVYYRNGGRVIEDCKGYRTREYKLKKRIMAAMGYEIVET